MSPEQGRGDPLDARSRPLRGRRHLLPAPHGTPPVRGRVARRRSCSCTSPSSRADPRTVVPEREHPVAPRRRRASWRSRRIPAHRFGNADEFAEALGDALSQIESSVPKARSPRRPRQVPVRAAREPGRAEVLRRVRLVAQRRGARVAAPRGRAMRRRSARPRTHRSRASSRVEPGTGKRPVLVDGEPRAVPARVRRARRGPPLARGSPRGREELARRRAHRRRRRHGQDAPPRRVPRVA